MKEAEKAKFKQLMDKPVKESKPTAAATKREEQVGDTS